MPKPGDKRRYGNARDQKSGHGAIRGGKNGGSSGALTRAAPVAHGVPVEEKPEKQSDIARGNFRNAALRADSPLVARPDTPSLEVQSQETGAEASARAKPRRRKRGRGKKKGIDPRGLMRNLRSPVTPAPDVAYSPAALEEVRVSATLRQKVPISRLDQARTDQKNAKVSNPGLYAALDLGTNNCRLLVAVPQERGRFRVIDGFSRIVRLGEGLATSGRLSEAAMDRAIEALKICAEKLMGHNIRRHRLIATEACRRAVNGADFLERVKSETGMDLEIVDQQTEAYLAAEGCGALMDNKADAAVLFDIGGGSSELILVNRQGRKKRIVDQIVSWTSMPVGVVTLAERHGGTTVNREIFQAMIDEVRDFLNVFEGRDQLARVWKNGRVHLLGTSGTVTTLAGIHLGLPKYERRLVDGLWLSSGEIDKVIQDLLAMDYRQRSSSPCIGTERADLVMAGCAILEAIRLTWPSERLRVADRGLREGILTQMMEHDSAWMQPRQNQWRKFNNPRQPGQRNNNSGNNSSGNERDKPSRQATTPDADEGGSQ